jgi:hypothetical protein
MENKSENLGRLIRIHWFLTIRSQKIVRLFFVITAANKIQARQDQNQTRTEPQNTSKT